MDAQSAPAAIITVTYVVVLFSTLAQGLTLSARSRLE